MTDLKPVYIASTHAAIESALDTLASTWGKLVLIVIKSGCNKWDLLSVSF